MGAFMNTVLTAYGYNAFKRFLLPAIDDADYAIHLSKSLFGLDSSVLLKLEVVNGQWRFVPSGVYSIQNLPFRTIGLPSASSQA